MKNLNKKLILWLCLLFLALSFQQAFAGTCGTNVKYSVSGNTINFARSNSSSNAYWGADCGAVFKNDKNITVVKINEKISVTNGSELFRDFRYVKEMYLSKLDVSGTSNLSYMFQPEWDSVDKKYLTSLQKLDLSGWDLSNVVYMNGVFYHCSSLTSLNISGWDTSNVRSMWGLFSGCSSLKTLNVSGWNISNVIDTNSMFYYCSSLTALDVGTWNTSNVYDMRGMFGGCSKLTSLDLNGWDTSGVNYMDYMFERCEALKSLKISAWDTSRAESMDKMFSRCSALSALDISGWNISNVSSSTDMFTDCNALHTLTLGQNSGKKNIFKTLPDYNGKWYYVVQGNAASEPLDLYSVKTDASLFTSYNYKTMAGTWTTNPRSAVRIRNSSGTDITGKTITLNAVSYQLKAVVLPSGGSQYFSWSSNATGTATVDSNGKVTFKKTGTVTITASVADSSIRSASVKLTLLPEVKIKNSSGTDITGKTVTTNAAAYQLKAVLTPSIASQNVTWSSNAIGTATVDSKGKVTFKKAGTVTITAKASDGSGKSAWVKLTYAGPTAVKIKNSAGSDITGKTVTINSADYQLKAAATPSGALQKFTWASNATGRAAVDSNGKVTFKKAGTVTITAKAADGSGKSAWVKITMEPAVRIQTSAGTDITGKTLTVNSASHQLKAVITPSMITKTMTWKSSATGTATVDSSGKVTFKKVGTVTITAAAADGSAKSAWVKLSYAGPTAVTIKNSSGSNITGKTVVIHTTAYQLKAAAAPSGALQKFTWAGNAEAIAAVNSAGKVTFTKAGTVTVTAKAADGSGKSAWVKITYAPLATVVKIKNSAGTDITGKTVTVSTASLQLKGAAGPSGALQKFTWKSSNTGIAAVDSSGKVSFKKAGTVTVTVTASDGSGKSAWVKLKCPVTPVKLEITDSNVRGKNKEIQVVIPWSSDLTKVECKLYDDETNELVSPLPAYRERMDANGRNRIISWVGDPLENGHVYRMSIRVWNGVWSDAVKKYGMPITNAYGATVNPGDHSMFMNTRHREPCDGTRYMIYDGDTGIEVAYKTGSRDNTTWTYSSLTNGKLYYAVAVPYRDYKGQRLWGPNENRIWFVPMSKPSYKGIDFGTGTVSIDLQSDADGIRVLYRKNDGALVNGCEKRGSSCTINNLNKNAVYEYYIMKFKEIHNRKYYSKGLLIREDTTYNLKEPNNPTVAMSSSGNTSFTITKDGDAAGISVLCREGEGAFTKACEQTGNSCSVKLDVTKRYTFYIMKYNIANGKKVYSHGIIVYDFSSNKTGTGTTSAADIPEEEPAVQGLEIIPVEESVPNYSLDLYRLEEKNQNGPVPEFGN